MNWTLTTPPVTYGITQAEAKLHLRIYNTDFDDLIDDYIEAAQATLFKEASVVCTSSVYTAYVDEWDDFVIPFGPVTSVAISYYNSSNSLTALTEGTDFKVDYNAMHAKVTMDSNPTTYDRGDAIKIVVTGGYSTVPAEVKTALRFIVADLFEAPQTNVIGMQVGQYQRATKHAISLISRRREI